MIVKTKEHINLILQTLGRQGFSGLHGNGKSKPVAFANSLPALADTVDLARYYPKLRRQRLIEVYKDTLGFKFILSPKAALRLMKSNVDSLVIEVPQSWDGLWRVVSFDIPTGKNKERQYLNRRLRELGLVMVQRSIWAHPFNFFEVLTQITDYLNISKSITYFEVSRFDVITNSRLTKQFRNLN